MNDIDITGPHKTVDNINEYYMVVIKNDSFDKMLVKQRQYIEWLINNQNYTNEKAFQTMDQLQMTWTITLKLYKEDAIAFKMEYM